MSAGTRVVWQVRCDRCGILGTTVYDDKAQAMADDHQDTHAIPAPVNFHPVEVAA